MPAHQSAPAAVGLRVDKWLWAARFYKTRSIASAAVHAGHVRVNGEGVKAARALRVGDVVDLHVGDAKWTVSVVALNDQRRPAVEAQQLYAETPESSARRATAKEIQRFAASPGSELHGRPTKKARRQIRGFNENF